MKTCIYFVGVVLFTLMVSCHQNKKEVFLITEMAITNVPEWSKDAIWYQIFVERFRNGDSTNNPTPNDMLGAYPDSIPSDWAITPWGSDWYKPDKWFNEKVSTNFQDNLQLRRYGGDLQGVLDKLDYLSNLGITAIYFNPVNDAPSLHKYDPRYWHHIDRNFGPNPKKDTETVKLENPIDPNSWVFTTADSLFLKIIDECHKRNIRLILDYSWNHTGMDFWALNDIRQKGATSEFADWYDIKSFDNPETPENELKYVGWYGIKYLPEMQKDIIGQDSIFPFQGNLHSESAKNHIFSVARRWLDPNKDGDPSDGIDGYRLDVAAEIPLGFWPEFRKVVREVNPQAYLVGEIWWQAWPDKLMEPQQFLKGDMFDAIMNYRWYRNSRWFFASAPDAMPPSVFVDSLLRLQQGIDMGNQQAMMNLTSSHDSPRTSTSLYNKNKYKYNAKPYDDSAYKIDKPDEATRAIQKMLLIHQFTYIGAPHIWYGDEIGMWGADDPDCRKPMVWSDLLYDNETQHPLGIKRKSDTVIQDTDLLDFYKELIKIRKSNSCLSKGNLEFIYTNDYDNLFAYARTFENEKILVLFNNSNTEKLFSLKNESSGKYKDAFHKTVFYTANNGLQILMPAHSANILIKIY